MKKAFLLVTVLSGVANAQTPPAGGSGDQAAPTTPTMPTTDTSATATTTTTTTTTAPETPVITAPAEPPKEEEKKDEFPKKLAVGTKGVWNPALLAQAWLENDRSDGKTTLSTFRLRRAEIGLAGEIIPKTVAYKVMFDAAKVREPTKTTVAGPPDAMGNPTTVVINNPSSAVSALQDFYITGISHYVDVSIGQFKIPVSWEGYNSSGKIMFPERAIVSNTFGDKRDLGIRLEKKWKQFGYSAGVFNGGGPNAFDTNVQKDLGLRLEYYPVPGLTLAGVTYDSVMQRKRAGTKDRWELDARYEKDALLVQAEAIIAHDVAKDLADATPARGMYILLGYTLKDPSFPMHGELQPVVRFGAFDPNTTNDNTKIAGSNNDSLLHFDVGVNYYLVKHEMKLQAAYQRMQFQDVPAPGMTKAANNQVILAAQVMY